MTTFTFNTRPLRTVTLDGNPWFVAADVCKVLGLAPNNGSFMHHLRRLGADETTSVSDVEVAVAGPGMAHARLVSESGLYKLIMRSDKEDAREFQDWVTGSVRAGGGKSNVRGVREVATGSAG